MSSNMTPEEKKTFYAMRDDIKEIKNVLVGNDELKTKGMVQHFGALQDKLEDHEKLDSDNFKFVHERIDSLERNYQQQKFMRQIIQGLVIATATIATTLITWYIAVNFG